MDLAEKCYLCTMKEINKNMRHTLFHRVIIIIVCAWLGWSTANAGEKAAYVVTSSDRTAVTFYYDDQKENREGTIIEIINGVPLKEESLGEWRTKAVFDKSFANFRPTSTAFWFSNFKGATIEGMENLNTESVTDMSCMFYGCNFTSLDVSHLDTKSVTDMGFMFAECSSLTSLDLSRFNTENVTNMEGMFYSCSSLTTLDLSSFNTEKVTNMRGLFDHCTALTSLNISNFNTDNVTTMAGMFSECSSLISLNVSNFNTQNVTDMACMFSGCSSLISLDVSNFNTDNVTNMAFMFSGYSLPELNVSNFNTENVTDMSGMFIDCNLLKTIYADGNRWGMDKVIDGEEMFCGCTSLVGGNGTIYDEAHTDFEYARIDKEGQPGYLTQKSTLSIGAVKTDAAKSGKAWFTIGGLRIAGEPTDRGIYIHGGKKVVVVR